MKRLLLVMALALTALTASSQKKVLVSYFSASGKTEAVAQKLQKVMGADIFKIEPQTAYSDADLDYRNPNARCSVEMRDPKSRPALAKAKNDVSKYDVIFIGFPIWWATAPRIINSYLESADFSGKTVILFATSGSSSIDKSCSDLKTAYPALIWKGGRLLTNATEEDMAAWKKELEL